MTGFSCELDEINRERLDRARQRLINQSDREYVTNAEMVAVMLDVYEHHLESNPGPLVHVLNGQKRRVPES